MHPEPRELLPPLICAVVLSARYYLLAYLTAQRQPGADIKLGVDERVERGVARVRSHAGQSHGIGWEQVRHHRR